MFSNVCKHYLTIYGSLKCTFKKVGRIKKKEKKNCEIRKFDYPIYLGYFYYHGTMILPCTSKPASIRNWVTFCG